MKLQGKKVLLTGATGGIGSAIALALAAQGAHLLITGRNKEKLNALLDRLEGDAHQTIVANIASDSGRADIVAASKRFAIDILINNAGTNTLSMLQNMSDTEAGSLLNINLLSPIMLCRDLAPLLTNRDEAVIVNIGSILGSIGYAGSSVYCASKFGLRGFTESLRREMADTKINVIYFAPRATNTTLNSDAMNQMNSELGVGVDQPDQVARQLVEALQSNKSRNYYLGWPESFFVKVNSLLPNIVDKSLFKQLPVIQKFANTAN